MKTPITAVGLAALLASAAHAESPFQIGFGQTLDHDSNVTQAAPGAEVSDWRATTSLEGRLALPVGVQMLRAEAQVGATRYRDQSQLNHNPYRVAATLEWSGGQDSGLTGDVGVDASSRLYLQGVVPAGMVYGNERALQLFAHMRRGLTAEWALAGGVTAQRRDSSTAQLAALEQRQWAADVGTRYQPSTDLGLRGTLRHTQGSYPQRLPGVADDYTRNDIEAGLTWAWTADISLDAALGYGREAHDLTSESDLSLWFGSADLTWRATPKLRWQLRLDRNSDTGIRAAAQPGDPGLPPPTGQALANTSISTGLALGANWEMAAKVNLEGRLVRVRRSVTATAAGVPASGSDTTDGISLGLRYSPMPALDLGCRVGRERRSVDGSGISLPFTSSTYGCWGQFWFGRT